MHHDILQHVIYSITQLELCVKRKICCKRIFERWAVLPSCELVGGLVTFRPQPRRFAAVQM